MNGVFRVPQTRRDAVYTRISISLALARTAWREAQGSNGKNGGMEQRSIKIVVRTIQKDRSFVTGQGLLDGSNANFFYVVFG
jgi:hypothetical protein